MRETVALVTAATACWVLGLGTGCSDAELPLRTPAEVNQLPSWVLWSNGALQASAGHALRRELRPDDERVDLVLLGYTQTLSELGLSEGTLVAGETCRACTLLRPASKWSARLEGGELTETWTTLSEVPSVVNSALIPDGARCDRCRPFESANIPADERPTGVTRIAFVTPWAGRALVAYADGTLRRVGLRQTSEPACVRSPAFRPFAAYRATETVMWVTDAENQLWRLDLEELDPERDCLEAVTRSSTVAWPGPLLEEIIGPPSADPEEIFGIALTVPPDINDSETTVSRRTPDGRVEVLGRLLGPNNDLGIAWAAPGEVIAVNGSPDILRIRANAVQRQRVVENASEHRVSAVSYLAERGYLFGTNNNLVLTEDGRGGFEPLAELEALAQRVDSIVPYEDGLVIGERAGTFRRYYDGVGYCPGAPGFGGEPVRHLLPGEYGELLGGSGHLYYAALPTDDCEP